MSKQNIRQNAKASESESLTLAQLIEQQCVAPVNNLDEIADLWPADDDPDLLMQYILNERTERRQLNK